MDTVDEILDAFKRGRKRIKEIKIILIIMTITLLSGMALYFYAFLLCPVEYRVWVFGAYIGYIIYWIRFFDGKSGPSVWKEYLTKVYRRKFEKDQIRLINIISAKKISCQSVYNRLLKKMNRIPQDTDKKTLIIAIFSLIIAMTNVLSVPLQNSNLENYTEFLTYIICIIILLSPCGYGLYKIMNITSKDYDEKKNSYCYATELLEDYLY